MKPRAWIALVATAACAVLSLFSGLTLHAGQDSTVSASSVATQEIEWP